MLSGVIVSSSIATVAAVPGAPASGAPAAGRTVIVAVESDCAERTRYSPGLSHVVSDTDAPGPTVLWATMCGVLLGPPMQNGRSFDTRIVGATVKRSRRSKCNPRSPAPVVARRALMLAIARSLR